MILLLKNLLFTVLVPGTVTVLVPCWILGRSTGGAVPGALRGLAVAVGAAGVAVYAWCVVDFAVVGRGTPAPVDPPKSLVVRGLYRHSRNPMYVGVLGVLAAETLWFGSWALLAWAATMTLAFNLFIRLYEEPTLRRLFGAAYADYCARVPRWLPWRGAAAPEGPRASVP